MATTKYIVNNLTGQTISGQQLQPYKVYTALVTQDGTNTVVNLSAGTLTIGVTYSINNNGGDFTNVGAPNNNQGTYFVATGTTPNNWGGVSLDYNTGAPVVTVLENSIGNIWWELQSTGSFLAKSDDLFTENKTLAFISQSIHSEMTVPVIAYTYNFALNQIVIETYDSTFSPSAGVLSQTPIEIRVYN